MKTSTNFSEMSDIFAAIAKAETKTQAYKNARAAYEGASAEFDGDAGNRVAADLMLKTYDEMLKARRALNASFTKLLTLFQATTSCYEDEHLREQAKRYYDPDGFIYAAKTEAMRLVKYIEY